MMSESMRERPDLFSKDRSEKIPSVVFEAKPEDE